MGAKGTVLYKGHWACLRYREASAIAGQAEAPSGDAAQPGRMGIVAGIVQPFFELTETLSVWYRCNHQGLCK